MKTSNELQLDEVFEAEKPIPHAQNDKKWVWFGKGLLALTDQGLLSGSNFFIAILLARWLSRDGYGAYAMGFSIFMLLSGFHNAFFLEPMSVFGPESYSRCRTGYVKKLLRFHFVLTFGLSMLVVVAIIL